MYDIVQDPAVSDKVKMETNPAYQEMPSDQNRKGSDPAYHLTLEGLMSVNQLEMLTIMKILLMIKILR